MVSRRTLVPTAGAMTIGLIASLALATPVAMAEVARMATARLALADPSLAGFADLTGHESVFADTVSGSGLARLRRRDSTVERCKRIGRRGPTAAGPRRVVTREQVAVGGCGYFLEHGTVDMDALAVQLSISRATLYRVVHSRDRLLADVLWRLAENALWRARRERTQYGAEGVLEVGWRFSALLLDAKPFRTFLMSEPDVAARILLTANGGIHRRAVQAQKDICVEATPPGRSWLTNDLDSVAYLLVRIFESTFFADLLASRQPDRELAERAIRAVIAVLP